MDNGFNDISFFIENKNLVRIKISFSKVQQLREKIE